MDEVFRVIGVITVCGLVALLMLAGLGVVSFSVVKLNDDEYL